jgi:hypothetical protein
MSRTRIAAVGLALSALALSACGSGSSSESPSAAASSEPAAAGTSYCVPLAAAYEIKVPSGETGTDEQFAAFAEAMLPAAEAAAADGRQDLADFFLLVAEINANPDGATPDQGEAAFAGAFQFGPEVLEACGVDLMS